MELSLATYEIYHWVKSSAPYQNRWTFEGVALSKSSRVYKELVGKLTYPAGEGYKAPQNPFNYRNC